VQFAAALRSRLMFKDVRPIVKRHSINTAGGERQAAHDATFRPLCGEGMLLEISKPLCCNALAFMNPLLRDFLRHRYPSMHFADLAGYASAGKAGSSVRCHLNFVTQIFQPASVCEVC